MHPFKAIAVNETLQHSKPAFATRIEGRTPRVKFQHRGQARSAVHYHFSKGYKDNHRNVVLFKFDLASGRYVSIFDSSSELAYAVVDGQITLHEALDSLDWDV